MHKADNVYNNYEQFQLNARNVIYGICHMKQYTLYTLFSVYKDIDEYSLNESIAHIKVKQKWYWQQHFLTVSEFKQELW